MFEEYDPVQMQPLDEEKSNTKVGKLWRSLNVVPIDETLRVNMTTLESGQHEERVGWGLCLQGKPPLGTVACAMRNLASGNV